MQLPVLEVLVLVLLSVSLELVPVPIGKVLGSLLYMVPLALTAAYSPAAAICVTVIGWLIASFLQKDKMRWSTRLFNAGQYGLSAYALTKVYRAVAGPAVGSVITVRVLLGLVAACVAFMVVNHAFIQLLLYTRRRWNVLDAGKLAAVDGLNFAVAMGFAVVFIWLTGWSALWAPVVMLPLVLVSQMFRLYRRMTTLRDVHTEILQLTGKLDVDTLTEESARIALKVADADACVVYLLDASGEVLLPNALYPAKAMVDFSLNGIHRAGGGVIWAHLEKGTWGYVPNTRRDPRVVSDGVDGRFYLSLAVFPLQTHGKTMGALALYGLHAYAFQDEPLHLVRLLSGQLSVLLENAQLYAELQEQSLRDPNSGLYNYRYLYEALERRVAEARRTGEPVSVAILDIDSFKKFNDTYGHLAGDAVLQSLAQLLRATVGSQGIVTRYGGEEFAVVLNMTPEQAFALLESIRSDVMRHVVEFQGYRLQGITISCGIAGYPVHATDDRDLLLKADSAMYWGAKQRGRNRTAVYAPEFDTQLFVDELTGLYTYHFVTQQVRQDMERGVVNWGIICFDIENFSFINATFGRDAGDSVLREVSWLVKESLRAGELACRFAADEFLVVLPGVHHTELQAICGRLVTAVEGRRFAFRNNVVVSVKLRHLSDVCENIHEPGNLFEQVGRLFGELNVAGSDREAVK